jgi:transcriptional regulator with XRE-family HTH domain
MNPDKAEIQHLLDVLRTILRMLAISNREVERRLGLKHSAVTRLFSGVVEAKLELVLGIARVIGLEYDELFAFAYPERRPATAESTAARRVRSLLADLQPAAIRAAPPAAPQPPAPARTAPAAEAVDREEMLRDLRKVVRQVLGEIDAAGGKEPEPDDEE